MTLCRMVDRLQDAQLVERRPDAGDRRAWQLFLTAKGWALSDELEPIGEQLLQEALVDMPNGDRAQLQNLLELFRSNLQEIDETSTVRKNISNG